MEEHYKTCKLSAGTVTKFPKEGDTYKFKQHCLMVDNPYYIVADFEASNATDFKPITTLNSHAQKVHRINSYCLYLYIQPQLDSFPYDDFQERLFWEFAESDSEEDQTRLTRNFFAKLNSIADALLEWQSLLDPEKQLKRLQKLHKNEYLSASECIYCKLQVSIEDKVLNHNHFTGLYNGVAHTKCNLLARKPTTIPVFFHNIKYDISLVLPLIGSSHAYGAKGSWRVSTVGNNFTCVLAGNLELRDTYKLLPLSLKELSKQLDESDCKLQRQYAIQCSSKYGKGIYPYEWVNSVQKFDNETFPAYEDFKNSLGDLPPYDDYLNALSFFNSKCNTFRDYHLYYLKADVLILADSLHKFSTVIHDLTGIYLCRAVSIPQASYAGLWRECRIEVPYITDPAMYDICKNACKGGLNIVAKRVTEVTNHMQEHIMYWDIKSMYPKAMSQPLPCGNFQWVEEPTIQKVIDLCAHTDFTKKGAIVVVGVLFPSHT